MLGRPSTYPCAVTDCCSTDPKAIGRAFRWVRARQEPGQQMLLWVPQKNAIDDNPELEAISRLPGVSVGTSRGRSAPGWREGPVLGMWAYTEDLAKIPFGRPTALCIVPWDSDRLEGWVRAVDAEVLGDGHDWQSLSWERAGLDPIVARGLDHLTFTINHSNSIRAGYERRDVVSVLLALHDAGFTLPAEALRSQALRYGWEAGNANHLASYCAQIGRGSRPRFPGRAVLRPDIVDLWRNDVLSAGSV